MVWKAVRNEVLIGMLMVALAFVFALNYQLFIVRNNFAPAGISGIATMIEYKPGSVSGIFR